MTADPGPWWRDAVIYEVYIRSFADSDGDGLGDLAGIRHNLAHLVSLGVDALWITPFYPSPLADGGYDVSDYRDIDPRLGTLAGFDALLTDAHALGLRVIVDIVPNHTSDQHVWFRAALAAGPGSPERDRYLFREGRGALGDQAPNDWLSVFGGPAWRRTPDGQWFLHLFAPEQPDLNWSNGEVRAEFESILRFWLDRDVDGFRIDVAHGLIKDPALPDVGYAGREPAAIDVGRWNSDTHPHWDQDAVHEIYRSWRRVSDSYAGRRIFVAEAWVSTPTRLANYVRADELHTAFNFDFLTAPWDASVLRSVIERCIASLGAVGAPTTWVLSNHDVKRQVTRYGDGDVGKRRARAAALLMLALPGGAYIYQGEELGLPEILDLPEGALQDPTWARSGHKERGRDGCRVPLPWSGSSPAYGFGPEGSTASWLPQPASWATLTAQLQTDEPSSMLDLYRRALRMRRENPALGDGTLTWLAAPPDVLVFGREPGFVCIVNLSDAPVDVPIAADILLASGPLDGASIPTDTAAWCAARPVEAAGTSGPAPTPELTNQTEEAPGEQRARQPRSGMRSIVNMDPGRQHPPGQ